MSYIVYLVGHIITGHLSNSSAKNAIRILSISNYFGRNLGCSFTQILNLKNKWVFSFELSQVDKKLGYKEI